MSRKNKEMKAPARAAERSGVRLIDEYVNERILVMSLRDSNSRKRIDIFTIEYLENSRKAGLLDSDHIPDLINFIAVKDGMNVLDVGTGLGYMISLLKDHVKNCTFVGIDIRNDLIEHSKKTVTSKSNKIVFDSGDCHSLPYEDHSFDVVTCVTLLMHISSPGIALQEMKRVCKDGGSILVIESMPLYSTMTRHLVDIPDQMVNVSLSVLRQQIEETKLEDSDYEIALKIPRYMMDLNLCNIKTKAYSQLIIDNNLSAEQQHENAGLIMTDRQQPNMGGFTWINRPGSNEKSNSDINILSSAMKRRAARIFSEGKFIKGTGDTYLKTIIVARGVCMKANH